LDSASQPATAPAPSQATSAQPIAWSLQGNFAAILERLRLSLVLSTRPNHIIFLGVVDGTLTATATLMTQPLGLAADSARIAVASPRSVTIFANAARLAAHYPGKRDYYDAFFIPRTIHFTGECHMHDMVFEGHAVIGANTNFSCICRVDDNFSFTPLWQPSFISQLRAEDRCHLNGFAGYAGELYYLTALAATDTEGGWREMPHSAGILIDARRNVIMRSDLCMPHSPRLINNELYVLNGGEGELLRVDRESGTSTVLTQLPAFTHGLCDYNGILFVGMSQNRASRGKEPPPVAKRHGALTAGIAAVSEQTGEVLGHLEFTSGVTEVYDVQVLPGIRRAGMQNLLATDGLVGVETPNSVFWTKRPDNDMAHMLDVFGTGNYGMKVTPVE
jgi:uncharacterized protein (TIGR03032 family)